MGAYDRVSWRGEPLTRRQRQALIAAEKAVQKRYKGFVFEVPQGSWQPQTSYSGTSHTGAGVVDLVYPGIAYDTPKQREQYRYVLRCLRDEGKQAAFGRGPWDDMVLHFHVCDMDDTRQADTVRFFQVPQYRMGYDGLSAGHRDRFPYRQRPITQWRYK